MRQVIPLAVLLGVVASTGNAASLQIDFTNNGLTNAIYLVGEAQNGAFSSVKFEATPTAPATFVALSSGVGKPAGDPNTYRNRALDGDPLDGGLGWLLVDKQTNANALTFSGGPPGMNITTAGEPGGRLFLGNLQLSSPSAKFSVKVVLLDSQGYVIANLANVPWPEPASLGLATLGAIGFAALRRRTLRLMRGA